MIITPAIESRSATVIGITWIMIAAAVILSFVAIQSATRQSDFVSVERQVKAARHAIEASVDELALQQESVAIWDDAASHVVQRPRDMGWIHDNIGSWLFRLFDHSETFILDGRDAPIYASSDGALASPERYRSVGNDLKRLVEGVRGGDHGPPGTHDRRPGGLVSSDSTVRTTPRAIHESHLMLVHGRPAVASAMLIKPSTSGYVKADGAWPILLSIRYLDQAFLRELAQRQLIADPRLSRIADAGPGEHSLLLRNHWGDGIGYFIWKPELPGSKIAAELLPASGFVLFVVALLTTFLSGRLRSALREATAAAREAKHLASHDPLTGLPNRSVLQDRMEQLTSAEAPGHFALVLFDVDEFKATNDTLGHDAGDALLKSFGQRLKQFARRNDLVARLGGDEFAILFGGTSDAHAVEALIADFLHLLAEPVLHGDKRIECQASAGASLYDGTGDASEILKQADLALYASKAAGRGTFRLYEPSMSSKMRVRQKMLALAKSSAEQDHVRPFYQPKVDLRTGRIVGFEALLRCCPPGGSICGPHRIAAAFEDSSLAAQLSGRMLAHVTADVAAWRAAGVEFGHVALNAAAADLSRRDFAEHLLGKLAGSGLRPTDIQLEVTESVFLGRSAAHVRRTLERLSHAGVKVALDDFGTGFASLSHLKHFPVDIIKIDRSFINHLQVDEQDGAIVYALIGLASALKLEVVAEGIETSAQRDFLQALGCTTGQGYLFGRAAPRESVESLLKGHTGGEQAAA